MLPILKMHFKVPHRGFRTGGVQFPRTVMAADARQVHVFDAFWGRLAGWGRGAGEFGGGVDGRVAHHAFEAVVGVLF